MFGWLATIAVAWAATGELAAPCWEATVDLPALGDGDGRTHRLACREGERLLVVAFLGVDCPLARLYAPTLNDLAAEYVSHGVRFVAVDANAQDCPADLAAFARRHALVFPLLHDCGTSVADRLGVDRNPAVVVLDELGRVCYRGRIDDQYLVGTHRDAATAHDLRRALEELLAGCPVTTPETTAVGCQITRPRTPPDATATTYAEHIAPLLERRCGHCHRAGGAGPMALSEYTDVVGWSSMIDEVLGEGRMPPWHADPRESPGRFANDPRLTAEELSLVRSWIAAGCPPGKRPTAPRAAARHDDWTIGPPDAVVSTGRDFCVPAVGTVAYQYFDVDPGFSTDRWVTAAEIRPGNRAVVHHCNVFLRPPGSDEVVEQGALGSVCLAAMASGTPAMRLPQGMAKRIPAGWRLVFVVHYVAIGSEQVDRTALGLRFAEPAAVEREVATRLMVDLDLCIPPGVPDHRVEHVAQVERDLLLLAMFPHLHLRGKSFCYEATYPDGRRETLLHVPRWDFQWQHRYELATPAVLPAGTLLRCVAHYDNSTGNPANPDPAATVRTGQRNEDEMFNGYYDVAAVEPDGPGAPPSTGQWRVAGLAAAVAGGCVWRARRQRRRDRTSSRRQAGWGSRGPVAG